MDPDLDLDFGYSWLAINKRRWQWLQVYALLHLDPDLDLDFGNQYEEVAMAAGVAS